MKEYLIHDFNYQINTYFPIIMPKILQETVPKKAIQPAWTWVIPKGFKFISNTEPHMLNIPDDVAYGIANIQKYGNLNNCKIPARNDFRSITAEKLGAVFGLAGK